MKDGEGGCKVGRRSFLVAGAGMILAGGMCSGAERPVEPRGRVLPRFKPLELKRLRIEAGAERPFKAVHVSDTHIVRADATERDPRKVQLAASRYVHCRSASTISPRPWRRRVATRHFCCTRAT